MRLHFGTLYQSSSEMQLNSIILLIFAFTEACQYQLILLTGKGTTPECIKTPVVEVIGLGKEIILTTGSEKIKWMILNATKLQKKIQNTHFKQIFCLLSCCDLPKLSKLNKFIDCTVTFRLSFLETHAVNT